MKTVMIKIANYFNDVFLYIFFTIIVMNNVMKNKFTLESKRKTIR